MSFRVQINTPMPLLFDLRARFRYPKVLHRASLLNEKATHAEMFHQRGPSGPDS
jgi:hypothetical protein